MNPEKPIIFLAFANEPAQSSAYLRELVREKNAIRKALEEAEAAGICEILYEPHASLDQIFDKFQKYRERIQVFHFGGHANSVQLLLQDHQGKPQAAHAQGLMAFLGQQRGLKLVFLNGCSSGQQARELLRLGVPAVVGTSGSVSDGAACTLSTRFYKGLVQGLTLQQAWGDATQQALASAGGQVRDLYYEGAPAEAQDGNPWAFEEQGGGGKWKLPIRNIGWLAEQQVVRMVAGIKADIPVPNSIFQQLNCDRREFVGRCRGLLGENTPPSRVFVLLGSDNQQPESLVERLVLEIELGAKGERRLKEVLRPVQGGQARLDTDTLDLGYSLKSSGDRLREHLSGLLELPEPRLERLADLPAGSPQLEGRHYDYVAVPLRIRLDRWLECPFALEFLHWLAYGYAEGYAPGRDLPAFLFFVVIHWEEQVPAPQPSGGWLKSLFGKKGNAGGNAAEQARRQLDAIDETDARGHIKPGKEGRIAVLDQLPGVPMEDLNEWLREFVLNAQDRTKILNTLLAKTEQDLASAMNATQYDPKAQLDMAVVEKILGHVLEAHRDIATAKQGGP
jgi:hypothetical protein